MKILPEKRDSFKTFSALITWQNLQAIQESQWKALSVHCYVGSFSLCEPGANMYSIKEVTQPVALLGEGPHWDANEQVLYYVDILSASVHRYDPKTNITTSLKLEKTVSLIIPIKDSPGKFVISYGTSIGVLDWDGQSNNHKNIPIKYQVDTDKPDNRINDGKADINGNIWFGTMGKENPAGVIKDNNGSLYKVLSSNCKLETQLQSIGISNGITWNSKNNVMFYIDSLTRKIDAFDYDLNTSSIKNRRTFFDFQKNNVPGLPDGMTIDSDDNLWIACFDGSRVIQVSKDGALLRTVALPAGRITSVAWGGPDLNVLYVTSARSGLSDEELKKQTSAGAVFSITGLGVTGRGLYPASKCLLA